MKPGRCKPKLSRTPVYSSCWCCHAGCDVPRGATSLDRPCPSDAAAGPISSSLRPCPALGPAELGPHLTLSLACPRPHPQGDAPWPAASQLLAGAVGQGWTDGSSRLPTPWGFCCTLTRVIFPLGSFGHLPLFSSKSNRYQLFLKKLSSLMTFKYSVLNSNWSGVSHRILIHYSRILWRVILNAFVLHINHIYKFWCRKIGDITKVNQGQRTTVTRTLWQKGRNEPLGLTTWGFNLRNYAILISILTSSFFLLFFFSKMLWRNSKNAWVRGSGRLKKQKKRLLIMLKL